MAGIVVDYAKTHILDSFLTALLGGAQLALFTNSGSFNHATVWGDLTEAGWTGYARANAYPWAAAALTADFHARAVGQVCVFTNSSGSDQTFTGWALLDGGSNLYAFNYYGSPQTIANGVPLPLVALFSDQSEF